MENELIQLFCELAQIPSPPLHEQKVAAWIEQYCAANNIECTSDAYGNLYIRLPATDNTKPMLLLSAHMDVVGDDSPVKIYFDGDFISAEGRTLGADDKVGVAQALFLAKNLTGAHGGLEIVLTRDEEQGMTGIKNFDLSKVQSKYVLVLDSHSLGRLETAGASYTLAKIDVEVFKGGHSGIDIADKTRPNAAKIIANIVADLPQGVYYGTATEVITSCNVGGIQAGDVNITNVINTSSQASYSIRSSSREKESELRQLMTEVIDDFNREYDGVARATITFEEHLPPFEKSSDTLMPGLFETAAGQTGVVALISTFHAGAETHIYANRTNAAGENFIPYLLGTADIENMHSPDERVNYKTMLKGFELLKAMFKLFNS